MNSLLLGYFGLPPSQTLRRLALVDPTDRYSRAWKPVPPCSQFGHYVCIPASCPSFSLFQRPPSPLSWRSETPRLTSCSVEPNSTIIRNGLTERARWRRGVRVRTGRWAGNSFLFLLLFDGVVFCGGRLRSLGESASAKRPFLLLLLAKGLSIPYRPVSFPFFFWGRSFASNCITRMLPPTLFVLKNR